MASFFLNSFGNQLVKKTRGGQIPPYLFAGFQAHAGNRIITGQTS
jgi:hypothetical protein